MHAGVEFDVDGIIRYSVLFSLAHHIAQHLEIIYLRLKMIGEHRLIIHHLGIHHHNGHRDAALAQLDSFIEHCDGEIGRACILQRLGNEPAPYPEAFTMQTIPVPEGRLWRK